MTNKKFFGAVGCILILLITAIPLNAANAESPELSVKDAADYAAKELLPLEGITGIAYTNENDEKSHKVIVLIESEEYASIVPNKIKGFEIEVDITGRPELESGNVMFQAMSILGNMRTSRVRPLVGGVSCGANVWGGATGTLGIVTKHAGQSFILSNAHVIALRGSRWLRIGTPIVQPGKYDGGTTNDNVGTLYKYIKLRFGKIGLIFPNHADAAIAKVNSGVSSHIDKILMDDNSMYTIDMDNPITVSSGDIVGKSGRTTGVTYSTVKYAYIWLKLYYGFRVVYFSDLIMVYKPFSEGGDSGSIVYKDGRFVGLHFAGSSEYSWECKAKYIKSGLGI